MYETPLTGLVLSGGGARAAYQVGVLRAIARLRREQLGPRSRLRNPFGVIVGTSAGAINAAALACHADRFDLSIEVLSRVWQNFHAEQVYRADSLGVIRSGAQWLTMLSLGWMIARWRKARPRSLLDNEPLAELLHQMVPLSRLQMMLEQRQLHALAVTASSYTSGVHVTFYSAGQPVLPWSRSQRLAVADRLSHEHLLASSAIPFVFPAKQLKQGAHAEWYGDGSMRQTAPLSPAIHLGAQRLLIIGAGRMNEPATRQPPAGGYPSLAQIAGHAMSSIFLDALAVDIERMQRINRTLALLPDTVRQDTPLRPIESLVISPSQRLDDVAARHVESLPRTVRGLLRGVGVGKAGVEARGGSALASYLLFEAPYTRELMALGEADVAARADEVHQFFGWHRMAEPAARRVQQALSLAHGLDLELP
ncbi:MAG: patatin-like phospholipase family protein [Proteobacteria bacterium]|nr:patatin-like phospholipase family protein [Pseudomonadota bacterium]